MVDDFREMVFLRHNTAEELTAIVRECTRSAQTPGRQKPNTTGLSAWSSAEEERRDHMNKGGGSVKITMGKTTETADPR